MRTTRQKFNLILTLAAMLTMAQTAWAADETKTFTISSASGSGTITYDGYDFLVPDGNIMQNQCYEGRITMRSKQFNSGNEGTIKLYPRISGKVKSLTFSSARVMFSDVVGTEHYVKIGRGGIWTNSYTEDMSSATTLTFTFTNDDGLQLASEDDYLEIKMRNSETTRRASFQISGTLTITYEPTEATETHRHNFSYNAVGNTLTATCAHDDGKECNLASSSYQISTSLMAPTYLIYHDGYIYPASMSGFENFKSETKATIGSITYIKTDTNEDYGTSEPDATGTYTASVTITAGGTGYTLQTTSYCVTDYHFVYNNYPQFTTDKSGNYAGNGQTVTITFTPKFGETLTELTVTGATTNYSLSSGITDNGSNTYTFIMPGEDVTIGATYDVTLSGRTLYKDGAWNTLCLPFDVTLEGSPLEGAVAKTLDLTNTVMSGTNVHIAFGEPVEVLTAGVPYIIKWENGNSIANPTFEDVAITAPTAQVLTSTDECTRFIGYYDAFDIDASDTDIFYMTADNTLKYTAKPRTLKAFRAYFQFSANGGSDVKALTFDMDFGDGDATGIELVESGELRDECEIYDLAGRRVSTPTKGLYIINGKKVFVK